MTCSTHCGQPYGKCGGWCGTTPVIICKEYDAIQMYLNGESVCPSFVKMKIRPQGCRYHLLSN